MTVAPLTAAVLAGMEGDAGIASGVNNAIARVAGLLSTAAVGAVVAAAFVSSFDAHLVSSPLTGEAQAAAQQAKHLALGVPDVHGLAPAQAHALTHAAVQASLHAFHQSVLIAAVLVAAGGLVGVIGVRNPTREIPAEECAGGQLVGASSALAQSARPAAPAGAPAAQATGSRA